MESREFSYKDRQLQVRATPAGNAWTIRVFENGEPVTAIVYTVSHETAIDASMRSTPLHLVHQLMDLAKTDIEDGIVRLD